MSIERMADRALPLTERVEAACLLDWDKDNADGRWDARDVLIADIAAADRLAPTGHGVWRILCGGCRAEMRVTGRLGTLDCPSCGQPIISTEATDA